MDSARYSRCRGHTKTVSPDLFRGPILFNWAFRRNWTPEQVRGDTLSKCHSTLTPLGLTPLGLDRVWRYLCRHRVHSAPRNPIKSASTSQQFDQCKDSDCQQ